MQQILKRFELIKTSITIEDEEIIELQIKKLLSSIEMDDSLKGIIDHLVKKEYTRATLLIDSYIEKNRKCRYGNYVVSFVDILGQQEELKSIEQIILDSEDDLNSKNKQKLEQVCDHTYEYIKLLRMAFRDEYYSFLNQDETSNEFSNQTFNALNIHSFSDFVMSYVSFENSEKVMKVQGIYYLMFSTSIVFLKMLSQGIVFRGGIDIGIGMEISNNELYGPALSNAYKLESHVADYPRIVVGDNLINFLYKAIAQKANSSLDITNVEFAKICLDVIVRDTDGVHIIDFLDDRFQKYYGNNLDSIKKQAFKTLGQEYDKFLKKKNQKSATKYYRAIDFFEERLNEK